MPAQTISVVICTWNRADMLDLTLQSMESLNTPKGWTWNVVVTNNNSTDETEAVIDKYLERLPLVKLFEPNAGKSHALNLSIREASGEFLVFTDDDVIVDPDWLVEYVNAIEENPDASYFGGRIIPNFESTPPKWIANNIAELQGMIVVREMGDQVFKYTEETSPADLPYGANMMIRKDVFGENPFDTRMGPRGKSLEVGEETAFLNNLNQEGHFGVWTPKAKVKHFVPAKRCSFKFFWQYYKSQGVVKSRVDNRKGFGFAFKNMLRIAKSTLAASVMRMTGNKNWLKNLKRSAIRWGQVRGPYTKR